METTMVKLIHCLQHASVREPYSTIRGERIALLNRLRASVRMPVRIAISVLISTVYEVYLSPRDPEKCN